MSTHHDHPPASPVERQGIPSARQIFTTNLAFETALAADKERQTGQPATAADAPTLFELTRCAQEAARAKPMRRSGRVSYAGQRFDLAVEWKPSGEIDSLVLRNLRGAVVLVADAAGPVFAKPARAAT